MPPVTFIATLPLALPQVSLTTMGAKMLGPLTAGTVTLSVSEQPLVSVTVTV